MEIASPATYPAAGLREPLRYVHGHHRRKTQRYVVTPTGYDTNCWIWRLAKTAMARSAHGLDLLLRHRLRSISALTRTPEVINRVNARPSE